MRGYRHLIPHLVLVGLYAALAPWLPGGEWGTATTLPPVGLLAAMLLLAVEPWAVRNVLAIELGHLPTEVPRGWQWFQKTYYFGILMLMAVTWRTYFRAVVVVFPLLNGWYSWAQWPLTGAPWYLKVPHALAAGVLLYRELQLQGYTFAPPIRQVGAGQEWVSRGVVFLLTTLLMATASQLAHEFMGPIGGGTAVETIRKSLPFLVVFFTFFYVPLRWIELLAGAVDSRTRGQATVFWAGAFAYMLFTLVYQK